MLTFNMCVAVCVCKIIQTTECVRVSAVPKVVNRQLGAVCSLKEEALFRGRFASTLHQIHTCASVHTFTVQHAHACARAAKVHSVSAPLAGAPSLMGATVTTASAHTAIPALGCSDSQQLISNRHDFGSAQAKTQRFCAFLPLSCLHFLGKLYSGSKSASRRNLPHL